jgi:hypothetical protein
MGKLERVSTTERPKALSAEKIMFELQVEQHHHDELYHREIARLTLHQRLNHMALHFAKYTGKIAATEEQDSRLRVYIDVLIIALSTANILNVELWDLVELSKREFIGLQAFGKSLAASTCTDVKDHSPLLRETAIASGRMAAACEKIDHLEEIPFREEMRQSIARLTNLSLAYISNHGIDPADAVRQRLREVKQRLKLHGRI